jgi:hypothetical protein
MSRKTLTRLIEHCFCIPVLLLLHPHVIANLLPPSSPSSLIQIGDPRPGTGQENSLFANKKGGKILVTAMNSIVCFFLPSLREEQPQQDNGRTQSLRSDTL